MKYVKVPPPMIKHKRDGSEETRLSCLNQRNHIIIYNLFSWYNLTVCNSAQWQRRRTEENNAFDSRRRTTDRRTPTTTVADRGPLCTEQSMLYCWVDIKLRSQSSNVLLIIAVRNQVGGHIREIMEAYVGFIHKSAVSHEWCHTVFVSLVFFKHFGC